MNAIPEIKVSSLRLVQTRKMLADYMYPDTRNASRWWIRQQFYYSILPSMRYWATLSVRAFTFKELI